MLLLFSLYLSFFNQNHLYQEGYYLFIHTQNKTNFMKVSWVTQNLHLKCMYALKLFWGLPILCPVIVYTSQLNSVKHWHINISRVLFGMVMWTVLTSILLSLRWKRRGFYSTDISHKMPLALDNAKLSQTILFTNIEVIGVICFPKCHIFIGTYLNSCGVKTVFGKLDQPMLWFTRDWKEIRSYQLPFSTFTFFFSFSKSEN